MTRQYSVIRTIDAPPDVVCTLLTDATGYLNWNPAVISIEGPIAAGATITGRPFGLPMDCQVEGSSSDDSVRRPVTWDFSALGGLEPPTF